MNNQNTIEQEIDNLQPEWDESLGIWKNFKATTGSETLPDPLWIFGYGSLCYSPGNIKYTETKNGYIKNFTRRFWQKSCDHRGTPESPGLVCTLLSDEEWKQYGDGYDYGIVYGKVYKIDAQHKEEVLNELDFREKGGYSRILLDVFIEEEESEQEGEQNAKRGQYHVQVLLYKGNVDNPNFVYDESIRNSISQQAEIIKNSIGPSGRNIEYLMNFYEYLKQIGKVDRYIEDLVQLAQSQKKQD